jgi:hypothetical protein
MNKRTPRLGEIIIYVGSVSDSPAIVTELLNDGLFHATVFHPVRGMEQKLLGMEQKLLGKDGYHENHTMPFSWHYQDEEGKS